MWWGRKYDIYIYIYVCIVSNNELPDMALGDIIIIILKLSLHDPLGCLNGKHHCMITKGTDDARYEDKECESLLGDLTFVEKG